jgi:hypothetical protein
MIYMAGKQGRKGNGEGNIGMRKDAAMERLFRREPSRGGLARDK